MSDEMCETEALRGHINCGGVKLNLDKLTFSLSCIYCDLEMVSIKEFGYHFQEHLVMSKAENERLLRNLEENVQRVCQELEEENALEEVPTLVTEIHDLTDKSADYEIEMLEDATEDVHVEMASTKIENCEEGQFVYQVMENDITTEDHNNIGTDQISEPETVDIGFDIVSDEAANSFTDKQIDGLSCDVCEFKFTDAATLRKHRQHHHRCQVCKKSFPTKVQLNVHMRVHKNKSIYECVECSETFTTTNELAHHQKIHERKALHLCSTCGKSFQDANLLRQHIKIHTSARPFVCIECNMTFSKSHALMLHTKLHSDVRKFSCSICRMTFAQNSGLINHLKDRHSKFAVNEA